MAVYLAALVIVDGLVTRNPSSWAGLPRAVTVLSLVAGALVTLWRSGVRLDIRVATIAGVIGAMVVAESYRAILAGVSLWVIYLGAYVTARCVTRDWAGDVARAGVIVSALAFFVRFTQPPQGMWNQNVIGAVLVVCLAAAFGKHDLVASLAILAGLVATGSRGALLGAFVVACVLFYALAVLAAPALAGALFVLRPVTANQRWELWLHGAQAFLHNLAFGLGPGLQEFPFFFEGKWVMMHSHNTLLGLAAQVGLVGLVVVAAFLAVTKLDHIPRACLAALAGVAAHSVVDDPLIALPVGVMLALVAAGTVTNDGVFRSP